MTSNRMPLSPVLDQILNGGTGVAINLPAIRKKVVDEERMFLTEGLNNAFIFKFPRFGEAKDEGPDIDKMQAEQAKRIVRSKPACSSPTTFATRCAAATRSISGRRTTRPCCAISWGSTSRTPRSSPMTLMSST